MPPSLRPQPATTQRDLQKVLAAGFGWQKTLFQWRLIEGAGKGGFDWTEADRVARASNDAGARGYFDVLGAHGAGYKAPPEMSPDQVASDPTYGGHRFFCFCRIEDLRNVMVRNGDPGKQIWLLEFGWTSDTVHPAALPLRWRVRLIEEGERRMKALVYYDNEDARVEDRPRPAIGDAGDAVIRVTNSGISLIGCHWTWPPTLIDCSISRATGS